MPVDKNDIQALNLAIKEDKLLDVRQAKSFEQGGVYAGKTSDFSSIDSSNGVGALADSLLQARKNTLLRRSKIVTVNGENVRVFPPRENSVQTDKFDAYARGLDFARGALEIVKHSKLPEAEQQKIIEKMKLSLATCATSVNGVENEKKAQKAVLKLNAELAMNLTDAGIVSSDKQAITAIRFASDYVMQRDINNTPVCSVSSLENGNTKLSIEEPLRFDNDNAASSEKLWDWQKEGPKPEWYNNLASKAGGNGNNAWLDNMMTAEKAVMRTLPTTSMTRFTPNAPNATVTTDVILDAKNNIQSQSKDYGVAITEPLEVGANNADARIAIAAQAHQQMVMNRLESNVEEYIERWGALLGDEGDIDFTVLHQTLVGDGITLGEDEKKAKRPEGDSSNMIDTKAKANAQLRDFLANKTVYVGRNNKVTVMEGKDQRIPNDARRVKVDVLETNNCINMHENRSRMRKNDREDSQKLVMKTVNLLEKLSSNDQGLNKDINTVKAALKGSDYSFMSMFTGFDYSTKQREAMDRVYKALNTNPEKFNGISKTQGHDMSLLIQSTAELKRTLHRNPIVAAFPVLGKLRVLKFLVPETALDRKSHAKAKYEGIVAQLHGQMFGGCMSSCDRRGEMVASRAAVKKQHALNSKIVRYNSNENRQEYKKLLSTQAKHNNVEMATGSPGTKDKETIGLYQSASNWFSKAGMASSTVESSKMIKQSEVSAKLRKPKTDKVMKMVKAARSSCETAEKPVTDINARRTLTDRNVSPDRGPSLSSSAVEGHERAKTLESASNIVAVQRKHRNSELATTPSTPELDNDVPTTRATI